MLIDAEGKKLRMVEQQLDVEYAEPQTLRQLQLIRRMCYLLHHWQRVKEPLPSAVAIEMAIRHGTSYYSTRLLVVNVRRRIALRNTFHTGRIAGYEIGNN